MKKESNTGMPSSMYDAITNDCCACICMHVRIFQMRGFEIPTVQRLAHTILLFQLALAGAVMLIASAVVLLFV